jgi:hypothetical protein
MNGQIQWGRAGTSVQARYARVTALPVPRRGARYR